MNATQRAESDKITSCIHIRINHLLTKMIRITLQQIRPQTLGAFVILCLLSSFILFGQTPPKKPEPQQPMGGVSTGTALNYTSRRTVGITDAKAPMVFED